MAWSTRELAELAGTTVNAIRHYHRIGLLDEPTRRYNGYKQYGVSDLMLLQRIRCLSELGVPLSQIREICRNGAAAPEVLRQVDASLASEIERLSKARSDIATILLTRAPVGSDLLVYSGVAPGDLHAGRERRVAGRGAVHG
ncbi:MerR family transcriptional regulator [Actinoplanes solisilvae]|uniref:MerR family transcriptional regulator n=1 Tax=Actinoplanes solisilvae TaxID=2486853 RepID=UPI000FD6EBDB|nr:MerR family transcriptional regulator [Actinoplanes solisilvae]